MQYSLQSPMNDMWMYEQVSGRFYNSDGIVVGFGYSGKSRGKNNPNLQALHDVGPIPTGIYKISAPHDTVTHGPFVLPLTPEPENQMFGRSGFLIHGDSLVAPGTASEGCIILPRSVRNQIADSGDQTLKVVSGPYQSDTAGDIQV